MLLDMKKWSEDELKKGVCFLAKTQDAPELGDLEDCPDWVRVCALDYVSSLLKDDAQEIKPHIFQARTNYEKRMRAKLIAARDELFHRLDWLSGNSAYRERFGRLDAVPDWVAEAAARNLKQQIFNISTGQRKNPATAKGWKI